jgi:site-specific recombinase XerD
MLDAIAAQLTKFNGPADVPREGLTEAQQELLREVIRPNSPSNPWLDPFVRVRNQALVEFVLAEGTRRGEALKQAISDIDFTGNLISVVRRPDDPKDSRAREPNVKRAGRILPMAEPLADLMTEYIVSWRSTIPAARRHDILFVNKDGAPLSKESVQKLFKTIQRKVPGFPKRLAAHLLRHTWNDNFSMHMDANGVLPEHEVRDRSYLMGWSEHSGSAARYTTRSTRKRANAHSLKMQEADATRVKE